MRISSLGEELLDLVYPSSCIGCGSAGCSLCESCFVSLAGRAHIGELDFHNDGTPAAITGYRAACAYEGVARKMVLGLKSSARRFAEPLGLLMVAAAGNDPDYLLCDSVCFVPSDRKKIAQRGYNPAEVLARSVAVHFYRPLEDRLLKVRNTLDQDTVRGADRWSNVVGAFAVKPGHATTGRVLLVDDVLTTGATANFCAGALRKSGASEVYLLVAAKAILRREG